MPWRTIEGEALAPTTMPQLEVLLRGDDTKVFGSIHQTGDKFMLWTATQQFHPWPFEREVDLENTITELQRDLFGTSRVYLETKKLIGQPGKTQNIPDGYLLDFSSPKKPVLYLVEVELAKHDPLRHIAQQLLGFSPSFQSTPHLHLKNPATLPPSTVVTSPVVFIANA